ncbi:MAG: hypothetical protein LBJ08_05465, partial [Bifidobacteriaceae bacterium]|nr:hypothetical protein [Bifidobacteriaceae bacterium]
MNATPVSAHSNPAKAARQGKGTVANAVFARTPHGPATLRGSAMKRAVKPIAWAMALTFGIGTGAVVQLAAALSPAHAEGGTVVAGAGFTTVPDFGPQYLYEVHAANGTGVFRWDSPTSTVGRRLVYTPGSDWSTGQITTMAVGPDFTQPTGDPNRPYKHVAYHWLWSADGASGIPVKKVTEGSLQTDEFFVPQGPGTYYRGWSGGEVVQSTGEIFFSGQEDSSIRNNGGGTFKMMVYNPATAQYRYATDLAPATADDWLGASGSTIFYPASDMAVDAEGNAYLVVGGSSKYLIRVAGHQAHNTQWTWNKVAQISIGAGAWGDGTNFWGMAFLGGTLYLSNADGDYMWQIDTMSGDMTRGVKAPLDDIFDLASSQTAPVVNGYVYNDADGNGEIDAGETALAGQTVEIYDSAGTLRGTRTTDGQGRYSFIVNGVGPAAEFYIRLVQPQIGGVNAAQTWAQASGPRDLNLVTPLCASNGSDYRPLTQSGVCRGARGDGVDRSLAFTGAATSPTGVIGAAGAGIVTKIVMVSDKDVAYASFGVTTAASHGDAPYKTVIRLDGGAGSGPSHIQGSVHGDEVHLGEAHGPNTAAPGPSAPSSTDDPHSDTDDGVQIELANGSNAWSNPADQILAFDKEYRIRVKVGGTKAGEGKVQGWGGALIDGATPNATSVFAAGSIAWSNGGAVQGDGYVYGTMNTKAGTGSALPTGAPPAWARFRVSLAGGLAPTDDPPYPPRRGSADANANPWWVPGEVEDYRFFVSGGTLNLRARSLGGTGIFGFSLNNISGTLPSHNTDSIETLPGGAISVSGQGHAFQTLNSAIGITANSIPTGFNFNSLTCTNAANQAISVTRSDNTYTVPNGAVAVGEAITCDAEFTKQIGAQSTFALTPAGPLSVTGRYTATVTALADDGVPLADVEVRFALTPPTGATVDPPAQNGYHCKTDATGTCSVQIEGQTAGTYTVKAEARNIGTDTWVQVGTAQPRTFTFDPDTCAVSLSISPAGPLPAGSHYTGTIAVRDSKSNACTGL